MNEAKTAAEVPLSGGSRRVRVLGAGIAALLGMSLLAAAPGAHAEEPEADARVEATAEGSPQVEVDPEAAESQQAEDPAADPVSEGAESIDPSTPSAEAVATDRSIGGTITFPAGMTLEQKRSLRVHVNEVGERGTNYQIGTPGFSYTPTASENSTEWKVTGLKRAKHHIWVDVESSNPSFFSAPLYAGPYNPATTYDGPIDLTNGNFTAPNISMNIGNVRVTVAGLMEAKGRYDLHIINQQTGAATNVRRSIYSGWTEGNVNFGRHDFNAAPGTYILRGTLTNNGVQVYYDGTIFGTRDKSKAKPFTVGLFQSTQLETFDMREFIDVPKSSKFYQDIDWMARSGITTGVQQKDGTLKFVPKGEVTREAMVAFLYRVEAPSGYTPPKKSPFTDVKTSDKFYKQIAWAYENRVTTGTKQKNGTRKFFPKQSISREAMAAFMYRQYEDELPTASGSRTFTDVPKSHKFREEISWMAAQGITTGTKQPNGTFRFEPKDTTTREASAAFLHRAEQKAN